MITKEVVIDKIEILETGVIQIREMTRFIEDGVVINSLISDSKCIEPDMDIENNTKIDSKVKEIAQLVHTKEKKIAYLEDKINRLKSENKGDLSLMIDELVKKKEQIENEKKN
jgi:hypothetical protein